MIASIKLPRFAPLATPLVAALIAAHAPPSALAQDATIQALSHAIHERRLTTTADLAAVQQHGTLTVPLTVHILGLSPTVGRTMLSRWRAMGLLRPTTPRTALQIDSVLGLLLTRLLWPPKQRIHLPSIPPTEPAWWCWRQDTPAAPILPCPVPLPADVPPTARLWSPWAGAPWIDARIAHDDTSRPA